MYSWGTRVTNKAYRGTIIRYFGVLAFSRICVHSAVAHFLPQWPKWGMASTGSGHFQGFFFFWKLLLRQPVCRPIFSFCDLKSVMRRPSGWPIFRFVCSLKLSSRHSASWHIPSICFQFFFRGVCPAATFPPTKKQVSEACDQASGCLAHFFHCSFFLKL